MKRFINNIQILNSRQAHFICKLIPNSCPFERDVKLFGKIVFHIPTLCKINPVYEEITNLRFRAICYLADVAKEDVSKYITSSSSSSVFF